MSAQQAIQVVFEVEGRQIVVQPRPEDQELVARLLGGSRTVTVQQADTDTQGHALGDDIAIDVEGHAMTLRLPNAADADAIRRALAAGAITTAIVVGGAIAATQIPAPSQVLPAPGPARVVPAPEQVQPGWRVTQVNGVIVPADWPARHAPRSAATSVSQPTTQTHNPFNPRETQPK